MFAKSLKSIATWAATLSLLLTGSLAANGAAGYPNPGRDSASTNFIAGAYIIDSGALTAGATKQTINQGLKPYGLVYALLKSKVEVDWVINPAKAAIDQTLGNNGVDFTYDCDGAGTAYASKAYKTGAFVVPKEFAAQAKPIIDSWKTANAGLVVDGPCTEPVNNLPVFSKIESWPRTILDAQNGAVATTYYTNAGIPQGSLTDPNNPPAYRYAAPSQLTSCDDLYVMPHADPTFLTHKELIPFIKGGGSFYASCHAVSVVENLKYPASYPADPTLQNTYAMNLLSYNGLINYDAHVQGSAPYNFYKPSSDTQLFKGSNDGTNLVDLEPVRSGDPIAQFLGVTTAATQAGSEQIFIPRAASSTGGQSYWRPTTQIIQYDSTQANASAGNGPAASLLYGPAYGNTNYGYVMYQGGHSVAKGSVDDVAAQRAFFNMVMLTAVDRRPANSSEKSRSPKVDVIEPAANASITGGSSVPVKGAATGGSGSYNYNWSAACYDQSGNAITGGSFASATSANTTFTAPAVSGKVNCNMTLTVVDTCGRFSFNVSSVVFSPDANLKVSQTLSPASASVGGAVTLSITVKNQGKVDGSADGATNKATDVVFTTQLPAGMTFTAVDQPSYNGIAPTGAICSELGGLITCLLKDMSDEQIATITIMATVDAGQGGNSLTSKVQVTSTSADSNLADNTDSDSISVLNSGINLTVSVSKTGAANYPYAANAGSSVTYTYVVTRAGTSNLGLVSLNDNNGTPNDSSDDFTSAAGITGPTMTGGNSDVFLESGETWTYTRVATVSSSTSDDDVDSNVKTKRIEATVAAVDANSVAVGSMDDASVTIITPSLAVSKTADSLKVKQFGTAYFTLNVSNTSDGPATFSNVEVTDSHTLGGTLECKVLGIVVVPTSSTASSNVYTIASLQQGETWTARCTVSNLTTSGQNVLSASAVNPLNSALPPVTPNANSTVDITKALPDLSISKTASKAEVRKGNSFSYKVVVQNNSTTTTQHSVKVTDSIPQGLDVTSVSRTRINTAGSSTATTGVIAWDNFYGSANNAGTGWSGNWSLTGTPTPSISSRAATITFGSSSTATVSKFSRSVVLPTTIANATLLLECSSEAPQITSVKIGTTTLSASQPCGTTRTQVSFAIPTSALSASAQTLEISVSGSNSKKFTLDDVTITAGQIASDTFSGSTGGTGWNTNWVAGGSNTSTSLQFNTSGLYLARSSNNNYSGTYSRKVNIAADTFSALKLVVACKAESLESGDYLEVWLGGVKRFDAATSPCATYSSSDTVPNFVTVTLPSSLNGELLLEVKAANSNDRIYLEDLFIFGSKTGAVTSTDDGLTIAALSPSAGYDLAPGERIEFEIFVTVNNPPATITQFVNTASVTSTENPAPTNGTSAPSSTAVTTLLKAGFTVTKTASKTAILSGTSVTYTYVVKNTGNTQIANVTLVDANGAATDIDVALLTPTYSGGNTDAILEPGEIWTFTSGSSNLTTTVDGIVTLDGIEQIWEDTDDDPATPDVLMDYLIDEVTDHVVVTVINPSMTISTTSNHSSSASPLAAKIYSGGTVTYTYTVANTGSTNLESVIVVADNCPTPAYVSGDANSDHKMQPSETWIFTCTTTAVNATQSSQNVKAKAVDADLLTSVTTNTQQVGITVYVPASLTLTKTATNATNSASGSNIQVGVTNAVTYNYSLDNSGSTNVSVPVAGGQPNRDSAVVDDKCSPVTYVSGDTNTDGVLDTSETWEFTCVVSGSISQTTIGNATASLIDPLGNPAQSNTATNTVTVLAPSLLVKIEAANEYVKYGNSMTYTYTVENNGGTNIASFSPSDSNCAPLVGPTKSAATGYTSNNDGVLNVGEIWTYTCTKANITSDAMSNFTLGTVTDSLNYSGYVPAPAVTQVFVVDPSLSVVQKASIYDNGNLVVGPALDVPANIGDTVKYTYEISSGAATRGSSIAGLNNMLVNSITDAQCAPITIVDANADGLNDGDINLDGVLDPAETWAYTCSTTQVTQTAQVVDAQAEVTAASVVENLTLRPASVRVRVAGAAATASPSPGVTQTATPTASPSPSASPSASPISPKPSVSPSPVAASGKLVQRVYFTGDSAKLTPTAQKQLAALAKKAKSLGAKFSVAVIGRVKETADKSYDLRLSKQRATNVADRLRKLGLYGTYRTVAAGISPENKPISRRVEVTITWKK